MQTAQPTNTLTFTSHVQVIHWNYITNICLHCNPLREPSKMSTKQQKPSCRNLITDFNMMDDNTTDGGTSTNVPNGLNVNNEHPSEISALSSQTTRELQHTIETLRSEKHILMRQLLNAESNIEALNSMLEITRRYAEASAIKKSNVGKNQFCKNGGSERAFVFAEDKTNATYINEAIGDIFRGIKFKPKNFHVWDDRPNSFCQQVCNIGLGWPKICSKKHYWEKAIVPLINKKFAQLQGNATQFWRKTYLGKYYH